MGCCAQRYVLKRDADTGELLQIIETFDVDGNLIYPSLVYNVGTTGFDDLVDTITECSCCEDTNALLTTIDVDTGNIATNTGDIVTNTGDLVVALEAIEGVISAPCGSGEQNVNVCPNDPIFVDSNDAIIAGPSGEVTIPSGFIHASIAVLTGTASINGAVYTAGMGLSLPPMSYGSQEVLYPAYDIGMVTGSVAVNYHTK